MSNVTPLAQPEDSAPLRVWALFYARMGLRVFPLETRGKRPMIPKIDGGNGVHDATCSIVRVEKWWDAWPEANIGIATGCGLLVFDVDGRDGGHDAWDRVMSEHRMPVCPFVITGDGLHFYMRDNGRRVRNKAKLSVGIDVQGPGAYVVAPPSVHPRTGKRYQWARGCGPVATRGLPLLPRTLLDVLDPPTPTRKKPTATVKPTGGTSAYGLAALRGLCEEVRNATPGQPGTGRHDTLYRCAARAADLANEGHFDRFEAASSLLDAALSATDGHRREEFERTIYEAWRKVCGVGS